MIDTNVDRLYKDYVGLNSFLAEKGEISYSLTVDNAFRKNILLASASYFESAILDFLKSFAENKANVIISSLISNKALLRQYHTLFDWEAKNANKFFKLFGEEYASFMKAKYMGDEDFVREVNDFLEIGRERNRLVHQNFATYNLEKTAGEVINAFHSANIFLEKLKASFDEFLEDEL